MNRIATWAIALMSLTTSAFAGFECQGKADAGPAFLRFDILESNKRVKSFDMGGLKADGTILFYKGFCLKPNLILAAGSKQNAFYTAALGLGHCFPFTDCLTVVPSAGYSFSGLRTTVDLPQYAVFDAKETFRSGAPYVSIDATYKFTPCWKITLAYQYSWCTTLTTIKNVITDDKSHSTGPTYGFLLERELNDQWSINVGAAYNRALTKEKHGLRVVGGKLGIVRWF